MSARKTLSFSGNCLLSGCAAFEESPASSPARPFRPFRDRLGMRQYIFKDTIPVAETPGDDLVIDGIEHRNQTILDPGRVGSRKPSGKFIDLHDDGVPCPFPFGQPVHWLHFAPDPRMLADPVKSLRQETGPTAQLPGGQLRARLPARNVWKSCNRLIGSP